jgi:hypothetical protein
MLPVDLRITLPTTYPMPIVMSEKFHFATATNTAYATPHPSAAPVARTAAFANVAGAFAFASSPRTCSRQLAQATRPIHCQYS